MQKIPGVCLASALAVSLLLTPVSTAVAGTGSSGSGPVSAVSLLGSQFEGDVVGEIHIATSPGEGIALGMALLSKRELELYKIYVQELRSAIKEKRMPQISDAFILELFKNTTLLMLFSILAIKGGYIY